MAQRPSNLQPPVPLSSVSTSPTQDVTAADAPSAPSSNEVKCDVGGDTEAGAGSTRVSLQGHRERHTRHRESVRDCIIGFADGLTVPFALTAGLSS